MAEGAKILVVDDDDAIRKFLRISLTASGHTVIEARTGEQALGKAATERPAIVILDLGLPDLDGREVVRRLRDWFAGPILILSVRADEAEKVAALDAGADDYVVKPFGIQELLARLRVLLRARAGTAEAAPVLHIGDLTIDIAARTVTLAGRPVALTRKEFDLLVMLARHAGKVLTQRQLLTAIWGEAHVNDTQYLRVYVGQLRAKLADDPAQPRFIRTEPGIGYRLLWPESGL
ncbi:response regulator [Acuticoccus sp. M5D2P5]|uniref:response regulator n=1 Tax=Acuticoccus kalidii TaxID=2910977 RepID=UPI001F29F5B2|nr:response regulator [Acuticoccus kalidii]MCF3933714.1 response regulator [Acuticoccus kalidii]